MSNNKSEKPLSIRADCKLTFDEYVSRICDKASQSHSVLNHIFSFVKPFQKRE